MKKLTIAALAAVTALTATAASAQPYGYPDHRGHRYDRGYDRGYDRHDRWDRRDYRAHRRWERGQRFDHYRDNRYVISDYRYYRLPPPRPGYRYYRDPYSGDVVMVAIASGIIGAIIGNALAN